MKVISRRSGVLLAAVVLAAVSSGCGSSESGSSAASGNSTDETRVVTDAAGDKVEVPADPQRIVTLHYAATQPLLDLDVMPVGQGSFEEGILPEDLVADVEEIPVVTDQSEPQLEEIAELDPDLILAPNVYDDEVMEKLEALSPVYTFTLRGGDRANWQQRTEEVAEAINRPAKADELAAEFKARQKKIAKKYANVTDSTTVAVIGAFEESNFYAWGENNMTGTLLMPLGFTWSKQENRAVADEPEPEATVSHEQIVSTVGDADVLFLDSDLRGETNSFLKSLAQTPLYQQIPAVKAGHAYPAGKNTVAGYTDAHYTLDMVEKALQDMS